MNSTTVTPELVSQFDADGVVKVPGAVGSDHVAALLDYAEERLADPGRWVTDTNPGAPSARLFTERYRFADHPTVDRFVRRSGVAELAGRLMQATSTRLYFDHLLVKEPVTPNPTPWHQDIPYWPFLGRQICSVWIAATEATVAESSLEFVRGSHRWNKYFAPESFGDSEDHWTNDFAGERCPDVEAARDDYDIVGFDVEPGDALVFSAWIVHGAPGNAGPNRRVALSTRWLGDDARWYPHSGADPTVGPDDTSAVVDEYPADDECFPPIWERGSS